jgi:hypothetical protein
MYRRVAKQWKCFFLVLSAAACSAHNNDTGNDAATDVGDLTDATGGTTGDARPYVDARANGDASGTGIIDGGGTTMDGNGWAPTLDSSIVQVEEGGVTISLPDGGTFVCYRFTCNSKVLQCGDCEDNDGDGLVDSMDPECLGPCDNTEGPALEPGIGGDTGDQCKRDCYFDFGNGAGNDACNWAYRCDPLEPKDKCGYNESWLGTTDCPETQSQQCLDMCLPITPNGCDCFGCCTFPDLAGKGANSEDQYVWIGRTDAPLCTFSTVTDPAACPPCTPEPSCLNTCGRCEICIGKTSIPADCLSAPQDGGIPGPDGSTALPEGGVLLPDGGILLPDGAVVHPDSSVSTPDGGSSSARCAPGVQPCGLAQDSPCPLGEYCITGCCIPILM